MVWTSPVTVATGDIYTAAMFNTYTRDNTNHLRALIGNADPGSSNKVPVSTGAAVSAWGTLPDAAMTNQKVNQLNNSVNPGGNFGAAILNLFSGFHQVGNPGGIADAPVPAEADWYVIQSRYPNPGIDYRLQIAAYILDPTDLYVRGIVNGTPTSWFKIWTQSNDGSGSLLDADTIRTLPPGNTVNNVAIANNTVVNGLNAQLHAGLLAGNGNGNIPINNGSLNTNLNAQLHAGLAAGNASGNIPINNGTKNVNCNVDLLDNFDWFTPVHIPADGGLNPVNTTPTNISGLAHTATRTGTYLILWIVQWEIAGQLTATSAPNFRTRASRSGSGTQESKDCISGSPAGAIFGQHGHGILTVNAGDTIRVRSLDPTAATSLSSIRGENSFMTVIWIGN